MEFDNFDFIEDMSEDQKQKLIEKLIGNPKPKLAKVSNPRQNELDFAMKPKDSLPSVGGSPVNQTQRENKFVDTGEHKDADNETPSIELTERRRPAFKKIKQICTRCNEVFETHPQFKRDFYICDRCLKR